MSSDRPSCVNIGQNGSKWVQIGPNSYQLVDFDSETPLKASRVEPWVGLWPGLELVEQLLI